MKLSLDQIMALERVNYEANRVIAKVTPEVELEIRDDVILTSSELFPAPDTTHACLLRATPETADNLITGVMAYFGEKGLPCTIFLSPACTPPGLSKQLLAHGFKQYEHETWMILEDVPNYQASDSPAKVTVKKITNAEVLTFAEVFMQAYEMPLEYAPAMAQLLTPSVGLPDVYHYLGFIDEQPIATFSLICYQKFGILGSAGVLHEYRGRRIIYDLATTALKAAQHHQVETFLLQTTYGFLLERLLRIYGFKKAFTRIGYTLTAS